MNMSNSLSTPSLLSTPSTVESCKMSHTKSEIKEDLEYWRNKLASFEKNGNKEGVKVAKLLLNKYLDAYNDAII